MILPAHAATAFILKLLAGTLNEPVMKRDIHRGTRTFKKFSVRTLGGFFLRVFFKDKQFKIIKSLLFLFYDKKNQISYNLTIGVTSCLIICLVPVHCFNI